MAKKKQTQKSSATASTPAPPTAPPEHSPVTSPKSQEPAPPTPPAPANEPGPDTAFGTVRVSHPTASRHVDDIVGDDDDAITDLANAPVQHARAPSLVTRTSAPAGTEVAVLQLVENFRLDTCYKGPADADYIKFYTSFNSHLPFLGNVHPASYISGIVVQNSVVRAMVSAYCLHPHLFTEQALDELKDLSRVLQDEPSPFTFDMFLAVPARAFLTWFKVTFLQEHTVHVLNDPEAAWAAALAQYRVTHDNASTYMYVVLQVVGNVEGILHGRPSLAAWAGAHSKRAKELVVDTIPSPFHVLVLTWVDAELYHAKGLENLNKWLQSIVKVAPFAETALQGLRMLNAQPARGPKPSRLNPAAPQFDSPRTAIAQPAALQSAAPRATAPGNPRHDNRRTPTGWEQAPAANPPTVRNSLPYVCALCAIVDASATGDRAGCSNHKLHQCVMWDRAGVPRPDRNDKNLALARAARPAA